ncbi:MULTISPECIES: recombinase family protein [Bradyrhizobium]
MKRWQVDEFFIEGGVSGSVPLANRPEGQRLLAALQAGDVIITAKLDRTFPLGCRRARHARAAVRGGRERARSHPCHRVTRRLFVRSD